MLYHLTRVLQAKGIEPLLPEYEPSVLPLTLYPPNKNADRAGVEPTTFWLTAKRSNHWATGFRDNRTWTYSHLIPNQVCYHYTISMREEDRIRTYGTRMYSSLANYHLKPLRHSLTNAHYWTWTSIQLSVLIFETSASTNSAKWVIYVFLIRNLLS